LQAKKHKTPRLPVLVHQLRLVEGVGSTGHVQCAGEVEKADEGSKVIHAQRLIDVLVQVEDGSNELARLRTMSFGEPD
jgi:hypothetical protein